jgi:hypothetical protein
MPPDIHYDTIRHASLNNSLKPLKHFKHPKRLFYGGMDAAVAIFRKVQKLMAHNVSAVLRRFCAAKELCVAIPATAKMWRKKIA